MNMEKRARPCLIASGIIDIMDNMDIMDINDGMDG